jgi:hypothetical protein
VNAISRMTFPDADGVADDLDTMANAILSPAGMAWRPDANCIAAGDRYLELAVRCYAAAGLPDRQMPQLPDFGPAAAAKAVAWHCWAAEMAPEEAAQLLARLSLEVPAWEPQDPNEIAALVRRTFGRIIP